MKYAPTVVGILLGLLFVFVGMLVLLGKAPMPELPKDSPQALFMAAFAPTGYLMFVKAFEVIGGVLVAIPKTRNFGLLVLGPIIINILAYHTFIMKGENLFNPILIAIVIFTLFLLWTGRRAFAGLLNP